MIKTMNEKRIEIIDEFIKTHKDSKVTLIFQDGLCNDAVLIIDKGEITISYEDFKFEQTVELNELKDILDKFRLNPAYDMEYMDEEEYPEEYELGEALLQVDLDDKIKEFLKGLTKENAKNLKLYNQGSEVTIEYVDEDIWTEYYKLINPDRNSVEIISRHQLIYELERKVYTI